jgi:hypothetical protein
MQGIALGIVNIIHILPGISSIDQRNTGRRWNLLFSTTAFCKFTFRDTMDFNKSYFYHKNES